ncbi:hypothetical protein PUR_24840 [Paenibacillus sp. URB8-2]|nr:hypothetical protein PUR_24840 [Paenibacillus sp. URB8-2]
MFKPILSVGIYFLAILLLSYYFVGVSFIKALQMASLITIVHVLMHFIDRLYKWWTNKL